MQPPPQLCFSAKWTKKAGSLCCRVLRNYAGKKYSCMTFAIPKTRCFAAAGASLLAVSALFERARIKQTFLQVLYAGTLLLQVYPEIACRRFVEIADSRSSSVGFTPRRRLLCIINIIIHHAIIFYDDNGV